MNITYKAWLEINEQPVFGSGLYELMQHIRETGSLQKGAKCMGMSYRAAWGKIRENEAIMKIELLEKGQHGSTGAHLTESALIMMQYFDQIIREIDKSITEGPICEIAKEMNAVMHAYRNKT